MPTGQERTKEQLYSQAKRLGFKGCSEGEQGPAQGCSCKTRPLSSRNPNSVFNSARRQRALSFRRLGEPLGVSDAPDSPIAVMRLGGTRSARLAGGASSRA
jgi:hypothetical protein